MSINVDVHRLFFFLSLSRPLSLPTYPFCQNMLGRGINRMDLRTYAMHIMGKYAEYKPLCYSRWTLDTIHAFIYGET